MRRHINLLREFSVPLLLGVAIALFWANMDASSYALFIHEPMLFRLDLHFLTNDLFMVLFFGIAAAEITQSLLPGGDLNPPKKAANALIATLGGVVGPVLVYLMLNRFFGDPSLAKGAGIPTATDIALAWLVARIAFGKGHPAVAFLLLLVIADDAIGILIIALFYPNPAFPPEPLWLLLVLAGTGVASLFSRATITSYWPYLLVSGSLVWTGLYLGHFHPALTLIFVVPFLPHGKSEEEHLFEISSSKSSTLERFVQEWRLFVDFGMFMFGLVNAGVRFSQASEATWLVLAGLVLGKTVGISLFSALGRLMGFPLPKGMNARDTLLAGMIGGIGFTVALFIAGEAFLNADTQAAAKMGALFSIGIAVPAMIWGRYRQAAARKTSSRQEELPQQSATL
ncbi:MAG: Na+/H+ antiporter NhaA [Chlorobium sp.]